jgi:hypothetical protein
MRLRPVLVVALPIALLLFAGWYSDRARRNRLARRAPTHKAVLARDDAKVQTVLQDVGDLRQMRAKRDLPIGGAGDREYQERLEKVRAGATVTLRYLEEIALDRNEKAGLRVEMVNLIATHRSEETRLFLASLMGDATDDVGVRIAAIYPLMAYKDRATFEAFSRAYQDPAPFSGRYHFLVALGECRDAGAVPILRDALAADQTVTIRAHAAQGLGGFADDPEVRAELKRLALSDPVPTVRQNAVRAAARSTASGAEGLLREIVAAAPDAETKKVAEAFLAARKP